MPTRRKHYARAVGGLLLAAMLLMAAASALQAQIPGQNERSKRIGKRLMCMCGCNQVLVECNHVGCSVSTAMLQKLDERVARGESDDLILQSFIQEYGQKVLSQPPSSGFGLAGWVMPFAAVLAGLIVCWVALKRMKQQPAGVAPAAPMPEVSSEFLERARRDTDEGFGPSGTGKN